MRIWQSAAGWMLLLMLTLAAWFGIASVSASDIVPSSPRVYTLLILDSQEGNPYDEVRTALLQALERYGYVEGVNLKTVIQFSGNDIQQGNASSATR